MSTDDPNILRIPMHLESKNIYRVLSSTPACQEAKIKKYKMQRYEERREEPETRASCKQKRTCRRAVSITC